MGIRQHNKDHLADLAEPLSAVEDARQPEHPPGDDPLRFWTKGPDESSATQVDLHLFEIGEHQRPSISPWSGPFTGRPRLIAQLAPVLAKSLESFAPGTVRNYIKALREWWRLFDTVELEAAKAGVTVSPVMTVADIGEIHRQRAFDAGMDRLAFGIFVRTANLARRAEGLSQLYWNSPQEVSRKRHLPAQWQIDQIRFALKRRWFDARDTWETAALLLEDRNPATPDEARLLRNYLHFQSTAKAAGDARPTFLDGASKLETTRFYGQGYNVGDMLRGFYPDPSGIRAAFHLCQATTGWNAAVLLELNASENFVEPHPKDPTRYFMRGYKRRGNTQQLTEGLHKSQGSAGAILLELIKRTEPLRAQLRRDLSALKKEYKDLVAGGASAGEKIDVMRTRLQELQRGVRSPWLYVSASAGAIQWLDATSVIKGVGGDNKSFLDELVESINAKQPADRQLARLKAGDYRDAFAASAYNASGGMVLYVMKALGHSQVKSTQTYLDNKLLNDQTAKLYRKFSNAFWHEIRLYGRVDPTIIAKWARDGDLTDEQRERLDVYRSLLRSRIGVGCKEPTKPPMSIAPAFKPDGVSLCHVQRCTLCEHAVVFPDSLPGLSKRLAELRYLKSRMATVAFLESSFGEELQSTELVLSYFDSKVMQLTVSDWEERIVSGEHRVIEFEGMQAEYA